MTLYDFLKTTEGTFDTYDTVYDAIVTVDWIDEIEEFYDKFCMGIIKFVTVDKAIGKGELACEWTDFITRNITVFREFTEKNWRHQYEDDEDEFIYQWINEIHYWMAGYTSEDIYKDFVENYMTRLK